MRPPRPTASLFLAVVLCACAPVPAPVASQVAAGARQPSPVVGLAPQGGVETARVVRVVDGDTLIIDRGQGRERLRYIGIDAPESVKPDTPVEFMGMEASAANAAMVEGQTVFLETDVSDRDRFDRLLRYVWLRDGAQWTFVNLELVRQGYAQVSTFPPDVRWRDAFRNAQRVARDAGIGLWGPATPAP
ncbi:MAG TPA: thermonuclease family protein [Candidatus Limnocylindrales bacterium]|jgi:micrococcal nuclease